MHRIRQLFSNFRRSANREPNSASSFSSCSRTGEQQSATRVFADSLQATRVHDQSRLKSFSTLRAGSASSPPRAISDRHLNAIEVAKSTVRDSFSAKQMRAASSNDLQHALRCRDFETQMSRRWKPGDVYAPHDLSGAEMQKWKKFSKRSRPKRVSGGGDVIDQLKINPLDHYKNFGIMSEYMTETGRIKSGADTGLRPVNQRRMARAIRRAIGNGLMPSVHRHPELIKIQLERQGVI